MTITTRASLRRALREKRRSLSVAEQNQAADRLFHRLVNEPFFIRARRIAFYFANDGEMDPLNVLVRALSMGKHCFLPILSRHRPGRVSFARLLDNDLLILNRWGIPEPEDAIQRQVSPLALDLVFVPVVGFDAQCNRLGMGKGYYDRTFEFRSRCGWQRPRLVGLAYDCQRVEKLPVQAWDVPLDAVITEQAVYRGIKRI